MQQLISNEKVLQLNLNRSTSGLYICEAKNGLGAGISKQVRIQLKGKTTKEMVCGKW